jgi:hypothetical protein
MKRAFVINNEVVVATSDSKLGIWVSISIFYGQKNSMDKKSGKHNHIFTIPNINFHLLAYHAT